MELRRRLPIVDRPAYRVGPGIMGEDVEDPDLVSVARVLLVVS
jgi:hypothetical protein